MSETPDTPDGAPSPDYLGPKRSLVLSGGGMRLSYQAGAIKALFDAGLCFAHMDGTSGGSLNLSMILSGQTPEECCARWRNQNPKDFASLMPVADYLNADDLTALGDATGVVDKVLPHLGINPAKIREAIGVQATYNVCNYNRKVNEVVPHQEIDTDLIVAGMSLPGVMPPVVKDGTTYIDSAFLQNANLMEAVRRGAEEIWLLWGMGNTPTYRGGALRLYVQMLEMSANGALNIELERIGELNERISRGDSPYGQETPIRLHVIRPEYPLPLDPDLYLGKVDHTTLIEMGYADAREYLGAAETRGVPIVPGCTQMKEPGRGVRLCESLAGPFALDETDPEVGTAKGKEARVELAIHATIDINDVGTFAKDPNHKARLTGHIDFTLFGTTILGYAGTFNLSSPAEAPDTKLATYELSFDHAGQRYHLAERKELRDDPGLDLLSDLTTLRVTLHRGGAEVDPVVGAGILELTVPGLVRMAKSLTASNATSIGDGLSAVAAFGKLFLGSLWGIYGKSADGNPAPDVDPAFGS